MLIHVCDNCHEKIEGARFDLRDFTVTIMEEKQYQLMDKEFCSLYCQQKYIIDGMKGRGLDDNIQV